MYIKFLDVEKRVKKGLTYNINYCFYSNNIYCLYSSDEKFKDTFVRIMSGLVKTNKGIIDVNGQILTLYESFPSTISIMLGEYSFNDKGTVCDNLRCSSINNKILFIKNLKKLGIDPYNKANMMYYSKGMKKRIEIVNTIVSNADIFILNNVFNDVETCFIGKICSLLREEAAKDKIIIVTCDDLQKSQMLTDNILVVNEEKRLIEYDNYQKKEFIGVYF